MGPVAIRGRRDFAGLNVPSMAKLVKSVKCIRGFDKIRTADRASHLP